MGQVDCKRCSIGTFVSEQRSPGTKATDCVACPYGNCCVSFGWTAPFFQIQMHLIIIRSFFFIVFFFLKRLLKRLTQLLAVTITNFSSTHKTHSSKMDYPEAGSILECISREYLFVQRGRIIVIQRKKEVNSWKSPSVNVMMFLDRSSTCCEVVA